MGLDVTVSLDESREDLLATLSDFAFRAETADLAVIYFAGHGVEVQGENFLIPVDAEIRSNADVARQAISLSELLNVVASARLMRLVILDACRDNPFTDLVDLASMASSNATTDGGTRSVGSQGLASVNPDRGTLVAFAASAGQVSFDGSGQNGYYAQALVDALGTPDTELGLVFRKVRDEVLEATRNRQEPFTYGSLSATPFYIGEGGGTVPAPAADALDERFDRVSAWAGVPAEQARELLQLADAGDTRSMLAMGYMRLAPGTSQAELDEAIRYFERAAEAGSAEAQFELAKLYAEGRGLQADPRKAIELFEQAAAQNEPRALNRLGYYYFYGEMGLPEDPARAVDLIGRAAEARDPRSMYNFAALVDDGLVAGEGPKDAGVLLYRGLRSGSMDVYEGLVEAASQFKLETRQALQAELQRHGFYDGSLDGNLGSQSRAAMLAAMGRTDG
jgi:uncharacterized caspase-like protein